MILCSFLVLTGNTKYPRLEDLREKLLLVILDGLIISRSSDLCENRCLLVWSIQLCVNTMARGKDISKGLREASLHISLGEVSKPFPNDLDFNLQVENIFSDVEVIRCAVLGEEKEKGNISASLGTVSMLKGVVFETQQISAPPCGQTWYSYTEELMRRLEASGLRTKLT